MPQSGLYAHKRSISVYSVVSQGVRSVVAALLVLRQLRVRPARGYDSTCLNPSSLDTWLVGYQPALMRQNQAAKNIQALSP